MLNSLVRWFYQILHTGAHIFTFTYFKNITSILSNAFSLLKHLQTDGKPCMLEPAFWERVSLFLHIKSFPEVWPLTYRILCVITQLPTALTDFNKIWNIITYCAKDELCMCKEFFFRFHFCLLIGNYSTVLVCSELFRWDVCMIKTDGSWKGII